MFLVFRVRSAAQLISSSTCAELLPLLDQHKICQLSTSDPFIFRYPTHTFNWTACLPLKLVLPPYLYPFLLSRLIKPMKTIQDRCSFHDPWSISYREGHLNIVQFSYGNSLKSIYRVIHFTCHRIVIGQAVTAGI